MANRTTIEIYTRQRTLLHPLQGARLAVCAECRADVLMISPDYAASILQVAADAVAEMVAGGTLHAFTTNTAATLICCNSIFVVLNHSGSESQTKTL